MQGPFSEFALLLLVCAVAGAAFVRLRQPVLIAYIVVGIAVGPAGFELVTAHDQIDLLAQVGVAVLLFAVGLKLDLHHIRHIGPVLWVRFGANVGTTMTAWVVALVGLKIKVELQAMPPPAWARCCG